MTTVRISILKCQTHGAMCVCINDLRITHSKCCGSWKTVRTCAKAHKTAYVRSMQEPLW